MSLKLVSNVVGSHSDCLEAKDWVPNCGCVKDALGVTSVHALTVAGIGYFSLVQTVLRCVRNALNEARFLVQSARI